VQFGQRDRGPGGEEAARQACLSASPLPILAALPSEPDCRQANLLRHLTESTLFTFHFSLSKCLRRKDDAYLLPLFLDVNTTISCGFL
jgi:hypothetical protein